MGKCVICNKPILEANYESWVEPTPYSDTNKHKAHLACAKKEREKLKPVNNTCDFPPVNNSSYFQVPNVNPLNLLNSPNFNISPYQNHNQLDPKDWILFPEFINRQLLVTPGPPPLPKLDDYKTPTKSCVHCNELIFPDDPQLAVTELSSTNYYHINCYKSKFSK